MAQLIIQNGSGNAQKYTFGEVVTIGRSPENTIVIDHESASGRHAEINANGGIYTLRDLQSTNGTTVNGASVSEMIINDGDVIVFGAVVSKFVAASPRIEPPEVGITGEISGTPPLPENGSAVEVKNWVKDLKSILNSFRHTAAKVMSCLVLSARQFRLKAKIEKLKVVDLNIAHYALGKKCYEAGVISEQFGLERKAIAELEQRIKSKRDGHLRVDRETTGEKIRRIAGDSIMVIEAQLLTVKRKQLFLELGRRVALLDLRPAALTVKFDAIREINAAVARENAELVLLSSEDVNFPRSEILIIAGFSLFIAGVVGFAFWTPPTSLTTKARNETRDASGQYSPLKHPPQADDVLLKAREWARLAPSLSKRENETHIHTVAKEVSDSINSYGIWHKVRIRRSLEPYSFGFPASYKDKLYEALLIGIPGFQYSKRDLRSGKILDRPFDVNLSIGSLGATPSMVLIITKNTKFRSSGEALIFAKTGEDLDVKMTDGFSKKISTLREIDEDFALENRILELKEHGHAIGRAYREE